MAINAAIPLQAAQGVPNLGRTIGNALNNVGGMMQLRDLADRRDTRAAVKNAFASNEMGSPELEQALLEADPQAGLAYRGSEARRTSALAASQQAERKNQEFRVRGLHQLGSNLLRTYNAELRRTQDPELAQAAVNTAAQERAADLAKYLGREQAEEILSNGFTVPELQALNAKTAEAVTVFDQMAGREKGEKGFTLSPGQRRYDAQGNVVAEAPAEDGKKAKPQTDIGKLTADYEAGLLAPDDPQENRRVYQQQLAALLDKGKAGGLDKEKLAQLTEQQGDNYVQASKDYVTVRDAYQRVRASAEEPSAAGDLSLIFNYMKMLDPNSVVRESEFATAAASGSYGERIQGLVNRVATGQRLTDEIRKDFVKRSRGLMRAAQSTQALTRENYRKIAKRWGLEEDDITDRVVMLETAGEQQAQSGPSGAGGAQGGMTMADDTPTPQTQADFDALPSGALYYDPDDPPGSPPRVKP